MHCCCWWRQMVLKRVECVSFWTWRNDAHIPPETISQCKEEELTFCRLVGFNWVLSMIFIATWKRHEHINIIIWLCLESPPCRMLRSLPHWCHWSTSNNHFSTSKNKDKCSLEEIIQLFTRAGECGLRAVYAVISTSCSKAILSGF